MSSFTGTLLDMGKKQQRKANEPTPEDPHKGIQVNLRIIDPRLLAAIEAHAATERRSRNLMINLLLEEALKRHGLWPPSADEDQE